MRLPSLRRSILACSPVSLPCASRSAALAALCGLATFAGSAQTFAAGVGTMAPPLNAPTNSVVRPHVPGHHRNATEKLIYARVRHGMYTVDGMVAKIQLNYDVQGANFMYLFVPGIGTAVVSISPEPDALMTSAALQDDELTFTVDGHHFGLTGVTLANDRGVVPANLYVHLDRAAWHLSRLPMVGFGDRAELPYVWPGALPPEHAEESEAIPPIPATLLPSLGNASAPPAPAATSPASISPAAPRPAALR
ncbi:MAG: hypothetical protein ACRYFU_11015 [Janthinobacterium lividum]